MDELIRVRCYSGAGAVTENSAALCALGKKALIMMGRSSARRNGSFDELCAALKKGGVSFAVFDEVEENPSVATVLRAAAFGAEEGVDFVVGLGGGSALDASKATAFLLKHPGAAGELLHQKTGDDSRLPLALIPTTCGTGSELTAVSVLTMPEQKTKRSATHKLFGDLAFLDGRYLASAPLSVLHNTAFDALTHMLESCLNTKATELSRSYVFEGLRLWRENLPVLLCEREAGAEDYQRLMEAAAFGGRAIAHTGTSLPHGLSYSVTARFGVPHGRAVGYFSAGYLAEAEEGVRKSLLGALGLGSLEDFQRLYLRLCGAPEVPDVILTGAVEELLDNKAKCAAAPFPVDRQTLERIAFYTKKAG